MYFKLNSYSDVKDVYFRELFTAASNTAQSITINNQNYLCLKYFN